MALVFNVIYELAGRFINGSPSPLPISKLAPHLSLLLSLLLIRYRKNKRSTAQGNNPKKKQKK